MGQVCITVASAEVTNKQHERFSPSGTMRIDIVAPTSVLLLEQVCQAPPHSTAQCWTAEVFMHPVGNGHNYMYNDVSLSALALQAVSR